MALATYLVLAMASWVHLPAVDCTEPVARAWEHVYAEPPEDTRARLEEIAGWLAYEAEVRHGPARTALELAAIAFEESRFARYVDSGACNRAPRGWMTCDSGRAFGVFQFHPDTVGDVFPLPLRGVDLLASRELQVRIAWDLRERRPRAWTTWGRAERRAAIWAVGHSLPERPTDPPVPSVAAVP